MIFCTEYFNLFKSPRPRDSNIGLQIEILTVRKISIDGKNYNLAQFEIFSLSSGNNSTNFSALCPRKNIRMLISRKSPAS